MTAKHYFSNVTKTRYFSNVTVTRYFSNVTVTRFFSNVTVTRYFSNVNAMALLLHNTRALHNALTLLSQNHQNKNNKNNNNNFQTFRTACEASRSKIQTHLDDFSNLVLSKAKTQIRFLRENSKLRMI